MALKRIGLRGISIAAETEIRSVLKDPDMDPRDALRCIDEIVARYTGCGNALPAPSEAETKRLENAYPTYFDWAKRS